METEEDDAHRDDCPFCDGIVTIFKVMTGMLENLKDDMPPAEFNQALFKLRKCEYDINFFKGTA